MVVTTWVRVTFHLSLVKAGYWTDVIYPYLTGEETEGGKLPAMGTSVAESVGHGMAVTQDHFLQRQLLGSRRPVCVSQTPPRQAWVGQGCTGQGRGWALLGVVRLGKLSLTCTSVGGDNTREAAR